MAGLGTALWGGRWQRLVKAGWVGSLKMPRYVMVWRGDGGGGGMVWYSMVWCFVVVCGGGRFVETGGGVCVCVYVAPIRH